MSALLFFPSPGTTACDCRNFSNIELPTLISVSKHVPNSASTRAPAGDFQQSDIAIVAGFCHSCSIQTAIQYVRLQLGVSVDKKALACPLGHTQDVRSTYVHAPKTR